MPGPMLRLLRSLHTSGRCLQHAAESLESPAGLAKEEIEAYVKYFRTSKELRPLVYREKNASDLLSRDLWDEVAKKRVVPLEPPPVPAKSALGKMISEASTVEELYEARDLLVELSKKPNYTAPYHVNVFLEKSAEMRKFPHALTYIYTQSALRERLDAQNLNMVLFYLYINNRKSLLNAVEKAKVATQKIRKANAVTDLMKASLYLKNGEPVPAELKQSIKSAEEITVPHLKLDRTEGVLRKEFNARRFTYLELSPVALEASKDPEINALANVQKIIQFVTDFQTLQAKLDQKDILNTVRGKSVFRRPRQVKAAAEEPAQQ